MVQGFGRMVQDFGRMVQKFLVESSGRIAFWSNRLVIFLKMQGRIQYDFFFIKLRQTNSYGLKHNSRSQNITWKVRASEEDSHVRRI